MTQDEMRRAAELIDFSTLAKMEERDDLARLLREEADSQGWRDIATAPRDGTSIMLSDGKRVTEGYWWERHDTEPVDDEWIGWLSSDGGFTEDHPPTHWRPLPPPPQGRES